MNLKITSLVSVVLVLVGLAGFYFWHGNDDPPISITVSITDNGFKPEMTSIAKGTRVIFKNTDTKSHWPASDFHPTHGIYPEFDPLKSINPVEEWSVVLKPGKWRYHDHLYPSFTGTIEVEK
ncbi:MAG: cupredoxin domain-containing protein [bacterium]|nr:cupredoxin domain-containing protein [bacterium]